jgi:hypothetical protein
MPSKLCPHTLNAHPDVLRFVEAGCPLVKLVDNFGQAQELLARRPDLIVVGRAFEEFDANAAARSGKSPQPAARELIERQREKYRLNPLIKIWEGPNEPVFGNADDPANMRAMEWYAHYEAERLRLLADMGLRGVVGNFATGTPDLPLWTAFLPAVDAAEEHNGFLGLHEYSSPWMWWLTGKYQTSNCDGKTPIEGEGDTGFLTLRYRKVYRQYLIPNGLGDVPLVVTECGLDSVGAVCSNHTSGSWKTHFDFWRGYDGARDPIDYWRTAPAGERDPERYYVEQLMWYDRELQKDPFVAGATLFTVGTMSAQWEKFDIGGTRVTQHVVDYIRVESAKPAPPTAPKPTPHPAPHPEPQLPPQPEQPPQPQSPPTPVVTSSTQEPVTVPPGPGSPKVVPNILSNASFEEGLTYFADDTRERAIPAGWSFAYYNDKTPPEQRQSQPWGLPITALINSQAVTPEDRERVFAGGVYCWKISGGNAPVWVRLFQSVSGLRPAAKYRFTVSVMPDMIVRTHPVRAYASDPVVSEVRLVVTSGDHNFDTGWLNGQSVPYGKYKRLVVEFTAPGDRAEVAVEVRGRFAVPMGVWYVDELSLAPVS